MSPSDKSQLNSRDFQYAVADYLLEHFYFGCGVASVSGWETTSNDPLFSCPVFLDPGVDDMDSIPCNFYVRFSDHDDYRPLEAYALDRQYGNLVGDPIFGDHPLIKEAISSALAS